MGKNIIVTGASKGIGQAVAEKLAFEGYTIGINYNEDKEGAEETLNRVILNGGQGMILKADVSSREEVKQMVSDFTDRFGYEIHGLVNNAGIYQRKNILALTPEDWQKTIDTNLTGPFLCVKAALPFMEEGGKIINVASVLAHMGSTKGAHYTTTKAGIIGFTKALARELATMNINVNCVAPGATDTEILAGDTPEKRQNRERGIPLGRIGQPEEIAETVAFLMSDKANYITGETVNVNGGLWMA